MPENADSINSYLYAGDYAHPGLSQGNLRHVVACREDTRSVKDEMLSLLGLARRDAGAEVAPENNPG